MSSEELPPVPSRPHRHADFPSSTPVAPARPGSEESLPMTASTPTLPQVPTKRPTKARTTDLNDLLQSQESLLQEEKQRLLRRKELELEKRKMQYTDREKELGMLERRREELIREKEREEKLRRQADLEAERTELEQLEKEQQLAMERLVKLEDAKRKLEEKKNMEVQCSKNSRDSSDDVILKKAERDFHTKAEDGIQEPEIPRRPERSKKFQAQDAKRQPMIPERRPQSIGRRSTEPVLGMNRRPENLGKYHINEENIDTLEKKTWTPGSAEQSKAPESEQYSEEDISRVPDKAPGSRKDGSRGDSSLIEKKTDSRDKEAFKDLPALPERRSESLQKKPSTTEPPIEKKISDEPLLEDRGSFQKSSSTEFQVALESKHTPLKKEASNLEEKSSHDHSVTSETKPLSGEKETEHETMTNELTSSLEGAGGENVQNNLELTPESESCLNSLEKDSKTVGQSSDEKVETGKQTSDRLEVASSEVSETKPTEESIPSDKEHEKPEIVNKSIQGSDISGLHEGKTGESSGEQGEQLKKKAPPVPKKKPSSRIAAFQEMLRKQQMADAMHGSRNEAESTYDEQNDKHKRTEGQESSQPSVPQRPARHSINADRSKFANNLNGIFALPGMSPIGSLPPSFAKKLGPAAATDGKDGKNESSTSSSITDVRSSRARGPRGRKLPSKVASVEKVNSENKTNQIEIFRTWKTVARKREESVGTEGKSDMPVAVTAPTHFDLDEDKAAKPFEGSADKEDHVNDNEHEHLAPPSDVPFLDATRGTEGGLPEASRRQESSRLEYTQDDDSSMVGRSVQEEREKQHEEQQNEKQPVIPQRPTRHTKRLEKVEKISNPEFLPEQYEQSKYDIKLNFSEDLPEATEPMPETTFSFGGGGMESNSRKASNDDLLSSFGDSCGS